MGSLIANLPINLPGNIRNLFNFDEKCKNSNSNLKKIDYNSLPAVKSWFEKQ